MTETTGLARIEKAELREAWPHEAADFTPWLANHVSELGATLGLEFELQSEEAPVGKFSLDLLARVAVSQPRSGHREPTGADRS